MHFNRVGVVGVIGFTRLRQGNWYVPEDGTLIADIEVSASHLSDLMGLMKIKMPDDAGIIIVVFRK